MAPRGCVISPDYFCFICGEYTVIRQQRNVSDFVKKVYFAYFKLKLGDQDKAWAPHKVCRRCEEDLRLWFNGKKTSFRFGIPMIWREQQNHTTDCYFCSVDVKGFNTKNKKNISYPNLDSAIRPVPHSSEIAVPQPPSSLDDIYLSESEDEDTLPPQGESSSDFSVDEGPQLFSQKELNDLVRDLGLSKESAELLGSRLKNKNLLSSGTSFSWYRHREKEFTQFFYKEGNLVYCNDVQGLMNSFEIEYDSSEWRLFIDSSKTSLKAVLLHNGNKFASLPVGHSVHMDENYNDLATILEKIKYQDNQWMVCGDLKILSMLLGQQAGYTKYPCFLCLWDSRARDQHWTNTDWPPRETLTPGEKNIINTTLIPPEKVLLPPLHIKLGLIKQFVKSLPRDGNCFRYLCSKFPKLSEAKLKEGVFTGPDIRKLLSDPLFVENMNEKEKEAWSSFKNVVLKFLGNDKDPDYKNIVQCMLTAYKEQGCKMSLKVHFLHSHVDYFPENLGAYSEEQGERFHQDVRDIERRYQGRWDVNMLADYCWMLKRETKNGNRKRVRRSIKEKKERFRKKKD